MRAVTRLVDPPTPDRPLALAVSGGPDSMAMLALATAAFPGSIVAATVDHGLRADAADEAAMVARWCAAHAVPHATLTADRPPAGASLQAQARRLRYALLGDWALHTDATALATAHHADDQAETFLMRAARASGPAGLAGIRPLWAFDAARWDAPSSALPGTPPPPRTSLPPIPPTSSRRTPGSPASERHGTTPEDPGPLRSDGGAVHETSVADDAAPLTVIRPLLDWRRSELRAIATGLPFVDDPANADPRHDRTVFRALLANADLDPVALAAAAAHCREADEALTETVDWLWRTRRLPSAAGEHRIDVTDLPRELRRRLCRTAIGDIRRVAGITEGRWSDGSNIEPLLATLDAGRPATHAGVLVIPHGAVWQFRNSPPRRS
ncbi:tRNA lysidine(34) synthetase TilS [Sphingomonas sp. CFBP 13720]|uniref:tRNA lysidine(34) synthetase TilS n=1 Tax=Sphingomonas sp. CFBP 13720 TaxID=2775302 RepID=UPI0018D96597|nr:tRNA lysidine(34) synthetase TilS [Sphingomonas sp. CFBP 13720]